MTGSQRATPSRLMPEIVLEIREQQVDGGTSAAAVGYGIHTKGEALE